MKAATKKSSCFLLIFLVAPALPLIGALFRKVSEKPCKVAE